MAKERINKCIELLEQGENLYYTGTGPLTYENGKKQAKTWADSLVADFEHNPFDLVGLQAFMQGLVDGGPTNSGHRTPTVIATLPSNCRTLQEVRANAWQVRHVLSTGVHGILHTHARQADAVRAFVEECRYPFQTIGLNRGLVQGQRGAGGQGYAAGIWGVTGPEYTKLADPWPLNPEGELMLGLKIEDRESAANAEYIAKVPGLAFAEWGPGDMGMSFGYADAHDPPYPTDMDQARTAVKNACDDNGMVFLSSWNDPSLDAEGRLRFLMDWGVRIISGGGEEQAKRGREITGRQMPV
ncbi:MAG: aldolase/citrate lyase family protein [Candidatus Poribacteria bacterium]|jgi:4-hydroxy-2-oxoheptanedioate aldolase|nr:aldolase/citrate lyase family protein [Candidatus Poribacteria bacterium]MDP6749214.1 aldolase/citrate lyase family protein [Candidatus Poribacteria bacterium]MDP6995529.1 aldolase/citrate lyase family protein [Candidatus Poribacteria bacterium]